MHKRKRSASPSRHGEGERRRRSLPNQYRDDRFQRPREDDDRYRPSPRRGDYQHPDAGLRLVHAYENEPELSWTVSVGMRKADQALVEAVNAALDKLISDGTVSEIYASYGVEHRKP